MQKVEGLLLGHSLPKMVDIDCRSVFRLADLARTLDQIPDEHLQTLGDQHRGCLGHLPDFLPHPIARESYFRA